MSLGDVKQLQVIKAHTSDVTSVDFWGNSLLFTGSSDKSVKIWKWTLGEGFVEDEKSPLLGHKYGVTSVRVSPQGGVLASASVDGSVILWNISTGEQTNILSQEAGESVRACAFRPDGGLIASSDDSGGVCLWNQNKSLQKTLRFHEESVHTLAFSSDSNILLTACTLGNVRLFKLSHPSESSSHTISPDCSIDSAHDMGVLSADFCKLVQIDPSDSETSIYTMATCGTDHIIKIWRIFCVDSLKRKTDRTRLVPRSPQEHISGQSTIYCTELMSAQGVLTLPAHGSSVTCVRFNNRGTLLISCSMDKLIKIFDMQGNCLKTLREHQRYVNCIAVNNDSTIIASGSNDRTVIIWDLSGKLTLDSHLTEMRKLLFTLASSNDDTPQEFFCPITHEIMKTPVIAEDGFTYENSAIIEWFGTGKTTSPMTNNNLQSTEVEENSILKAKIDDYLHDLEFEKFSVDLI